jgi:stearoyl-CoA desaturase (delta-9 desaturase)
MAIPDVRRPDEHVNWVTSIPFFLIHAVCLLAIFTGVPARALILCGVLYFVRMFFITAGYHRYFAHRSYRMSRPMQFLMAFGGTTAAQKGPLWWAGNHRDHHRFADTDQDTHSPLKGFLWSHVGWILCDRYGSVDYDEKISDFARYPELRFVDKYNLIGPWALAIGCYLLAGWAGLIVGFFWSTVLLWHATFTVNSLAHVVGWRRYATSDTSRNSMLIALYTGGEGWHNNHHYRPSSARQGFYWWEVDTSYYALRALNLVGLVHDLRRPTRKHRLASRIKDGNFDFGMFRAYWTKASGAIATAKAETGERIGATRQTLDDAVHNALESAEELAKATRRSRRAVSPSNSSFHV